MEIKTVSLIGLGALGILLANQLEKTMPAGSFRVIADQNRIRAYEREGVTCNGEALHVSFCDPTDPCEPADLLVIAVKDRALDSAIESVKRHVGENTIILSLLNGITSEEQIGSVFGMDKVLHCVVQGTDGIRIGSRLTYDHRGTISFGELDGSASERINRVATFFERTGIPYEVVTDMRHRLWGKFMLNVGVNQTVAVYETNYGGVQREGEARDTMIAAMREVIPLANSEGIALGEEDLAYWLKILSKLGPEGQPSMRQDLEAKRYSEVGLFSGTVLELAERHGIHAPVNRWLYDRITYIESQYNQAAPGEN